MAAQNNASRLVALFGGVRATATAIDEDIATVSRWASYGKRGGKGHIPVRFNEKIMAAAKEQRVAAQARVWLCWDCPTCGQKMRER